MHLLWNYIPRRIMNNGTSNLVKIIISRHNLVKLFSTKLEHSVREKSNDENVDNLWQNSFHIDYEEVKSYKQFLNESKSGRNAIIPTLIDVLNVTKETATEALAASKTFKPLSILSIKNNDTILREAGVHKSTLRQHPFALIDTTENIKQKIDAIQEVDLEINNGIPLFKLKLKELLRFVKKTYSDRNVIDYPNKITFLSHRLNCDTYKICSSFCNYKFLLFVSAKKMVELTNYVLDQGMLPESIIRDFHLYRYSLENIKERVELCQKMKMKELRPWIVRTPLSNLKKIAQRINIEENILKDSTGLSDYISQLFNCDIEKAEALLNRHPLIRTINVENLSRIMKLLSECGYSITDIILTPYSLHNKCESLEKKYKTWISHGLPKPSLSAISKSNSIFQEQLNKKLKELYHINKKL